MSPELWRLMFINNGIKLTIAGSEAVPILQELAQTDVPILVCGTCLNHFKNVNDTYGHEVGDRILKFVADTLMKNARPFDTVGRWGGEEFIGIIRNVTAQPLEQLGNRLRVLVEHSYLLLENEKLHVSISIGATLMHESDNIDTLLKRADNLLYQSKNAGRNRLSMG